MPPEAISRARNLGRDLIDYRVLAILRGAGVPMSAHGVLGFARQWLPELTAWDVERALGRCETRALAEPVDGEKWRAL